MDEFDWDWDINDLEEKWAAEAEIESLSDYEDDDEYDDDFVDWDSFDWDSE